MQETMDNPVQHSEFLKAYEELSDAIFRHCFFRVSDRDVATDMTQDTFVKTWQAIEKGQQIENLRAFLYKVASNLVIDYYRKKKEISLDMLKEKGFDPVKEGKEPMDFMDLKLALKELDRLPEKYRQAVTMRYIEDMSVGEIADILGESENVVSVHIHRGLKELKKNVQS